MGLSYWLKMIVYARQTGKAIQDEPILLSEL